MKDNIPAATHYGPTNQDPRLAPTFNGMSVFLSQEEIHTPTSHMILAHEALHVAVNPGVICENGMAECFVGALEKAHVPDNTSYRMEPGWDSDAFVGTTGLQIHDFAATAVCPEFLSVRYLTAPHALQYMTAEQIWRVCGSLITEAKRTGMTPTSDVIRDTLIEEDPVNGKKVLGTLPFRPMKPGWHQFLLPQGRSKAVAYTFSVAENPAYEPYAPDIRRRIQFQCRGSPGKNWLEFNGKKLRQPISTNWARMPSAHSFNFTELSALLEQTTPGKAAAEQVDEIRCHTDRWNFRLRPPRTEGAQSE